ncbi:MAG: hypothetical protein EPO20_17040 [Betaproteobacteria bacterium]|nr:MAG: hypothetical protein EPO20_17040 [Betaproteobacteria bacterium]
MAAVLPPEQRSARAKSPGVVELLVRLVSETRQLASDFVHLAVLDARRAGIRLAMLLSAGLLIATLVITAWMGLVAAGIIWMLGAGVSWVSAIAAAAALNIVVAGALAWWARSLVSEMPFTALLRQLRGEPPSPLDEKH